MVTVAVDAGGADLGPAEVAAGASEAAAAGVSVLLFGPAEEIGEVGEGVEVIDAPISIAKAKDPAYAVRSTPDASIVQAARAVADGRAQALVSGGSTGPALAAALFNIKRDRGIYRPALALPLPMLAGPPVLLLDVGANVNCRPEHLVQFAHMGSAFSHAVLGRERPRVALLSNGEESVKGTPELIDVYDRLAGESGTGVADVVVMDGFIGNVTLKVIEGVSGRMLRGVHDASMSSPRSRLGAWMVEPAMRRLRADIDPEAPGGAYLLGLRRLGVVAHGRFSRNGFARAIQVAARGVDEDVVSATRAALTAAGALRAPGGGRPKDGG
jgi:glycerol-3-phosphate acyltransferase PlsX